ncbi:hypothetical protein E2C01_059446 [Portunus trituberculatus]|uniref:Uncharacterized protein n=1 Tax=Portunus trituberculatus TaxID=210409 RepID=A0A5B7H5D8_PORTR|nr:hypothetical protein [Portunus trituberculatus]
MASARVERRVNCRRLGLLFVAVTRCGDAHRGNVDAPKEFVPRKRSPMTGRVAAALQRLHVSNE